MTLLLGLGDGIIPSADADTPAESILFEKDSGQWVELSADMRALEWQRGRNRETDQYQAARGSVTLSNADRKYDPENTAGTYYGKLRPNRRLQLLTSFAGITYPDVVGYVDRWSQRYTNPNDATAVVTFTDAFKILNRQDLPRSVYTVEVTADNPEIWYRLDEPAGSSAAINSGSLGRSYDGAWVTGAGLSAAGVGLGQSGLIVRDSGTALLGDATHNSTIAVPFDYQLDTTKPFAIEAWIKTSVYGGTEYLWFQPGLGTSGQSVAVRLESTGKVSFIIYNTAATAYGVETSSALTAGVTYHVVCRHDADRTMHIYVNGVDLAVADFGVPGTTTGTISKTPGASWFPNLSGGASSSEIVDELAIYKTTGSVALSDARIVVHNSAGRTPWNGDLPGARANRILDLTAIGAAARNIDTCSTSLQATSLGVTVLAYLQKLADTEAGQLFIANDGRVRLIGRQEGSGAAYRTIQATLGDGAGEIGYTQVGYDNGEETIINRATVSRDGGVAIQYADAASRLEFQTIDATKDGLLHDSETYSLYYAQHLVGANSQPISRVGEIQILPMGDPSSADTAKQAAGIFPAVLGLELFERVAVKRRPQGVGAVISQEMMVDHITRQVGPRTIVCRYQLSPVSARKYWRLGVTGYSELGTSTRLGF